MSDQKTRPATSVITGEVRFSYLNVFEPKPQKDGKPGKPGKYEVSLIIKKSDTATVKMVQAAIEAAKVEGKAQKFAGKIPSNLEISFYDGDETKDDDDAYKGCYYISAKSNNKPGLVDASLAPIMDRDELYSGCYGRASINFYPYNFEGKKGIACGLNNLMKTRDGEPLGGGRSKAEDDFAAFAGGDSADDLL